MNEITVIARILSEMSLAVDIALFWLALRHKWHSIYFVWLVGFGVFSVIMQWATGLAWWLAVISVAICAIAMIVALFKEAQRMRRQQAAWDMETAAIHAERQRVLDDIARQHRELMQAYEAAQIGEESNDDQ